MAVFVFASLSLSAPSLSLFLSGEIIIYINKLPIRTLRNWIVFYLALLVLLSLSIPLSFFLPLSLFVFSDTLDCLFLPPVELQWQLL